MPQDPGLGPHHQPALPFVEMWEQHLESDSELTTNLVGDAHTTTTSRITGSNTLILGEPLVEADRARPGTAEHLAALPGIAVLDLDLPAALAVARQETWAQAHSRHAAQPTPDRPDGAINATTAPEQWASVPVRVLDLTP
jgi:hypothetical protein